jgi:hypothetical protein
VKIDGAGPFHAILHIENDLGRDIPNGGSDRRDGYGREMANKALPGKQKNRPLLIRLGKSAEVNISAI